MTVTALQNALDAGSDIKLPAGELALTQTLVVSNSGTEISGSGLGSVLRSTSDFGYGIAIANGVTDVTFRDLTLVGPGIEGSATHRAILVNSNALGTAASTTEYDANINFRGVVIKDWTTGFHVSHANDINLNACKVYDTQGSGSNVGYAITSSGKRVDIDDFTAINTTSGRHAIYLTGPAEECRVANAFAKGYEKAPFVMRLTTATARSFKWLGLTAVQCNTTPESNGGVLTIRHVDGGGINGVSVSGLNFSRCAGRGFTIEDCTNVQIAQATLAEHVESGTATTYNKFQIEDCANVVATGLVGDGIDDTAASMVYVEGSDQVQLGSVIATGTLAHAIIRAATGSSNVKMAAGLLGNGVTTVSNSVFLDDVGGNGVAIGT